MWNKIQQLGASDHLRGDENDTKMTEKLNFFFCDQPHSEYAHVVVALQQSTGPNETLWSLEALQSMCRLDEVLRSSEHFPSVCQTVDSNSNECCPSWSLGHYVALMMNRTSCADIDQQDVEHSFNILASCAKHYHGLQLSANCDAIVQEGTHDSVTAGMRLHD